LSRKSVQELLLKRLPLNRVARIALAFLLAGCRSVFALNPSLDINQYGHSAWTIREGFFKGMIYSIAQTTDGYLWLGTEFGLLRFDGVRASPWTPPGIERLPSDWIYHLLAARDGTLWIGTRAGLASWKDGRLTQYPRWRDIPFYPSSRIGMERYGPGRPGAAYSAQSETARRSATGGMAVWALASFLCLRTALAISGPAACLGFGGGNQAPEGNCYAAGRGQRSEYDR